MIDWKKDKKKSIFSFFIKMLFIFIVLDILMILLASVVASSSLFHKYGVDLITEVFYGLAVLIVMLLFKNSYVFTNKKENFWSGVCLAVPILIISFITFFFNVTQLETFSLARFINVLVLCIFVGITEEFLCRGWLQNEFIERYADNRKEVVTSIILSSLIFGFMHILNLGSQNLFETLLQIINASALGMLLGSIYYKTKNIWSVIFLHSFYDFSIFIGEMNNIKDCTYNTPTLGVTVVNCLQILIISSFWIIAAFYVLNKCDIRGDRRRNVTKINNTLKIAMACLLVLMIVPLEKLTPDYDKYQVCYKYEEIDNLENITLHFPFKNEYVISSDVEKITYDTDAFSDELQMNESVENIKYTFTLNDNKTVNVKSNISGYEIKLDIEDAVMIEVIENEDKYNIVILTSENEATIYYYEVLKTDMVNENSFMKSLDNSYTKFELPSLASVGYLTMDGKDTKYVIAESENNDRFIIMNNQLFVFKEQ